jgi:hypothetical protein
LLQKIRLCPLKFDFQEIDVPVDLILSKLELSLKICGDFNPDVFERVGKYNIFQLFQFSSMRTSDYLFIEIEDPPLMQY